MKRGTLFLVVGPSGAGKDTLLDATRDRLHGDSRYFFPARVITRPADAGGEKHSAVTESEFKELKASGSLLLSWSAHNLSYGIPITAAGALEAGQHVVANVSRGVLDEARGRLAPIQVISISVPVDVLRQRLISRGRESVADIAQRLARAAAFTVAGPDVITILNDSTPEQATGRFLEALGV